MKIGLTGSIACGKSAVSQYLRELGYFVADADAISRSLTAPGGQALPLLRECMESAASLRVPLVADVHAGHSWFDTK